MDILSVLKQLNAAHGPSGDEGGVRAKIEELARPYADEIITDTLGNLIVHKKGPGPWVMLTAHMDSIGFIVTHIEKEGFLRVGRLGGVSPEEKADFGKLKLDECFVDIGAGSDEEARKLVQVGDTCVYDRSIRTCGGRVMGPYLDDRLACAVLLCALERIKEPAYNLSLVFTVQEEVGLRGARTAAWWVDPDICVVVDVTDVDDTPGSEKNGTARLGGGAAIKVMDSSIICHPEVVAKLEEIAKSQSIPIQRDIMRSGGTDAGAIQNAHYGVKTGGISIPCRYIHTPAEAADLQDAKACVLLAAAFAQGPLA